MKWVKKKFNVHVNEWPENWQFIRRILLLFQEANATFNILLNESTRRLKVLVKKLGTCIEKSRPYHEAVEKARIAQIECQKAAGKFVRANGKFGSLFDVVYDDLKPFCWNRTLHRTMEAFYFNFYLINYAFLFSFLEIHAAAKETVALAEQRFMSNSHEWQFDNAWQEMLNHATLKVRFSFILLPISAASEYWFLALDIYI